MAVLLPAADFDVWHAGLSSARARRASPVTRRLPPAAEAAQAAAAVEDAWRACRSRSPRRRRSLLRFFRVARPAGVRARRLGG
jgi:hypothetical protein